MRTSLGEKKPGNLFTIFPGFYSDSTSSKEQYIPAVETPIRTKDNQFHPLFFMFFVFSFWFHPQFWQNWDPVSWVWGPITLIYFYGIVVEKNTVNVFSFFGLILKIFFVPEEYDFNTFKGFLWKKNVHINGPKIQPDLEFFSLIKFTSFL